MEKEQKLKELSEFSRVRLVNRVKLMTETYSSILINNALKQKEEELQPFLEETLKNYLEVIETVVECAIRESEKLSEKINQKNVDLLCLDDHEWKENRKNVSSFELDSVTIGRQYGYMS